MQPHTPVRSVMSPRSILLSAVATATAAGACEEMIVEAWDHASLVSRLASELSLVAEVDPADASAAGLVHDVGELLLLARHPEEYAAIRPPARAHHVQLDIEKARFGIDHAMLGAEHLLDHLVRHVVADAVADHHDPFRDSEATTIVVAAADEIADEDPDRRHALDLLGISPEAAEMYLFLARDHRRTSPPVTRRSGSVTQ